MDQKQCLNPLNTLLVLILILELAACGGGNNHSNGNEATYIAATDYNSNLIEDKTNGVTTVIWDAPTTTVEGDSLSMSAITGYRLYYGNSPVDYTNTIDIGDAYRMSTTIIDLPAGTYYFAITTVDIDGRESDYSNKVSLQIP